MKDLKFEERLKQGILLFDGAMGTQIQALDPSEEEWAGKSGCSEILNLTAPQKIQRIHENYLIAGADVIETNTFGANEIVLAEFQLQDQIIEINRAAARIAHSAVENYSAEKPRYIAGSIGPGTKLISLGQTDFDTMYRSYFRQAQGLLEGGVDLFIIETCQDLLQIKTSILSVCDAMDAIGTDLPIIVSVTVETTGTLLIGSEIGAVLATLEPFKIAALGMNCATGPKYMRPYIKQFCQQFAGPVICQPNAGLPQNFDGHMVYTLSIQEFAEELISFIIDEGVQIVGGCCGTTPEFIRALAIRIQSIQAAPRKYDHSPAIASLFSAQNLSQDPAPFYIGERANTNGSKEFREYLLNDDWNGIVAVAQGQQRTGAHGLDLCVAYTGRDEAADMNEAVKRIARQVNLPVFIDSTDMKVIETALKLYGGRAVINSINLEDGEVRADSICQLAKRYGAALIALTIDEKGMALEVERKVMIAKRIYDIAVNRHGLRPQDLIFDPLTFTLGSGDTSLADSGMLTLRGIAEIKSVLPGVYTNLGISNISFGLHPESREILNSVFLAEAIKAGLDFAIVNVKKIRPLYQIDPGDRERCLDLIYNRGGGNTLIEFIQYFKAKSGKPGKVQPEDDKLTIEEKIRQRVIDGNSSGMEKILTDCLQTKKPLEIINEVLIPAMKTVGDLFGSGEMQLPFVLQSAEVMKFSVDRLKPFIEKTEEQTQTSIVLATVRGDVHDIGKNLVDIILSNNGYKVYNLGIKCEIETMIQKVQTVKADVIGMSGLLVKSTVVMKENLEEMRHRGIHLPVLLGGAALTKSYVDQICSPLLNAPVVYCADAFDGLKAMELIRTGKGESLRTAGAETNARTSVKKPIPPPGIIHEEIFHDIDIPTPPFWGDRMVSDIRLDDVFAHLTETVLFRGRWGYRRGKMNREEYEAQLETEVRPELERLKRSISDDNLFEPRIVYGYYPCNSDAEQVILYDPENGNERIRFHFPRQKRAPHRCIADFFLPITAGRRDLIALQVATIGHRASLESKRLFESNQYKNYLMFHGLSVEAAEALAEFWHRKIRSELNITSEDGSKIEDFVLQKYRGSRYSFGYPACPDLSENRKIFQLLSPEKIGVTLTEQDQMVPEQTTSAFIVHHPQAKYFTVE